MSDANTAERANHQGTNLLALADHNERVVLDAIRRAPDHHTSQTELTRTTGLAPQTVSVITRRLLQRDLIHATGEVSPGGPGKPRTLLRLNESAGVAIGIHIDPARLNIVCLNLAGGVLDERAAALPHGATPHDAVELMATQVEESLRAVGAIGERPLGIGIASPGPVDATRGVVIEPPHLAGWSEVPLQRLLQERTGLPVRLEKDVTACAIGESWLRRGSTSLNLAYLYCSIGIGLGIVVGDVAIRGGTGNAGDIGAMPTLVEMALPTQPSPGITLGLATSPQAMLQQAMQAGLRFTEQTGDSEISPGQARRWLPELALHAERGDPTAKAIISRAATALTWAVVVLANILDSDEIVLGGFVWESLRSHAEDTIRETLQAWSATRSVRPIQVRSTALGTDPGAIGAGCTVLDQYFSPWGAGEAGVVRPSEVRQ